jgi:hypothetical protein
VFIKYPYPLIPIEGYFSHLKEKLTLHHGLRLEAKKNFVKWHLHFKNQVFKKIDKKTPLRKTQLTTIDTDPYC